MGRVVLGVLFLVFLTGCGGTSSEGGDTPGAADVSLDRDTGARSDASADGGPHADVARDASPPDAGAPDRVTADEAAPADGTPSDGGEIVGCSPGASRCASSGAYRLCLADGSGYGPEFACGAGTACVDGRCLSLCEADIKLLMSQGQTVPVGEGQGIGDPSMLVVPPEAQYRDEYVILTAAGYSTNWTTVTRPAGETVRVDGVPVPDGAFEALGDGSWEFAYHEVTTGYHTFESARPFGLMVYGYGPVTAYGYPGGMKLEP